MSRSNTPGPRARLAVTALEDRQTPSSGVASADGLLAVGSHEGGTGTATVYDADGEQLYQVTPYGEDFTGGVRVALADVTGDDVADLITAPGPGIDAEVKVYDGSTQEEVASFTAYEAGFTGGAYVAAADLNADGLAEIVTGADQGGGPRVRVFDGSSVVAGGDPTVLADFLAIEDENFRGGIRLALGDVNGDDVADLIVGAGAGGGPRVSGFDGASLGEGEVFKLFQDFFAFEPGLRNGCTVSVGDVDGDGTGDLVFGGGPGGAPRVRVADGEAVLDCGGGGSLDDMEGAEIANYFAGDSDSRDGVQVGTTESDDGTARVVALDLATDDLSVLGTDGTVTDDLEEADDDSAGFLGCYVDNGAEGSDDTSGTDGASGEDGSDGSTGSVSAVTDGSTTSSSSEDAAEAVVPLFGHRRRR